MRPVVLTILDGLGIAPPGPGNAFSQADTPTLDELFATYPYTELDASGPAVGLPDGYIGNSEVGHLHIGAGRVISQELVRINDAIDTGALQETDAVQDTIKYVREHDSTIHLMGIASDGGVHGHIDHLLALLTTFADADIPVRTHAFLDGRDVPPKSASLYLDRIETVADEYGTGHIASFMGRFYAMDRDSNWERTEQAYNALVHGIGRTAPSISVGLQDAYTRDRNDYFVKPTIIRGRFEPVGEHDIVFFINYRSDRAVQLTRAFIDPNFDTFATDTPEFARFVSMTRYNAGFTNPVVFEQQPVDETLSAVLSREGLTQLRLTESQKRPHVTYFLDGQRDTRDDGVTVKAFTSAAVPSYDQKPEMEADAITTYAVQMMEDHSYDLIVINYPNADLVGHTGDIDAAVTAVEAVDDAVARLAAAAREHDHRLLLTADHGTCETMLVDGEMHTAHTLNPVPFCLVDDTATGTGLRDGGLANIAPTILSLLDIDIPERMTDPLKP